MNNREQKIIQLMKSLDISREEAIEVLQDDADIDKGKKKDFDLSKEQEKEVKKSLGKREYKKDPNKKRKERPKDEIKIKMVAEFAEMLKNMGFSDVNITNESKIITFLNENDTFELNLIRKRTKNNLVKLAEQAEHDKNEEKS